MLVCDAVLRIVAVHAEAPIGGLRAASAGTRLAAADPVLARLLAPAARRALSSGQAITGLAVETAGRSYVASILPADDASGVSIAFAEHAGVPVVDAAAVVEAAADAVLATSPDGVIRSWNGGAERLYGYTAAEAVGRPIAMLDPPDVREPALRIVRLAAGGESLARTDAVRRRKDGTLVDVWIAVAPVRGADGVVVAVAEIGRDVTGRAGGEARLRAILDAALDATVTLDREGRVVEFNAAAERIFACTAEQVVGQSAGEVLWPLPRPAAAGPGERLDPNVARSAGRQFEVTAVRADGTRFAAQVAIAALGGRGPQLFVAHVRDISRRRRAEQALRESERRRRQLLASMLHAEAVERSRIATELHDDTVQVLAASLVALDRVALVARKAGHSRLEAAVSVTRVTLEEATDRTRRLMFELRPAVLAREGLTAAVRVLTRQVGREVGARTRVRGSLLRYDATVEELVYRSVQEALANVRKHARPDSISVTLSDDGEAVRAQICDDGLGFDVVDARSRPQAALHLGLDTLDERVRAAGGTVSIDSSPGSGTCIRIRVPVGGLTLAGEGLHEPSARLIDPAGASAPRR